MIMTVFVRNSTCVRVCVYEYVRVCLWGAKGDGVGVRKRNCIDEGRVE